MIEAKAHYGSAAEWAQLFQPGGAQPQRDLSGSRPPQQAAGRQGGSRSTVTMSLSGARATWSNYTLDGITNTDVNFNTVHRAAVGGRAAGIQGAVRNLPRGVRPRGRTGQRLHQARHQPVTTAPRSNFFATTRWTPGTTISFSTRTPNPSPEPPYRQNQYGFTLGGPVRIPKLFNGKNRLFFMSNFEGFKSRTTSISIGHHADGGHAQRRFLRRAHGFAGSADARPARLPMSRLRRSPEIRFRPTASTRTPCS